MARAEDDTLLRNGLASVLERHSFEAVGQTAGASQLVALVRQPAPDLVVVDIRMPPTNTTEGPQAAARIRQEFPNIGILVLSAHAETEHAMELLASGSGICYLLKSRIVSVSEFIETLQRIAKGGSVVDPALVQEPVSSRRRNDPLAALSSREREALALQEPVNELTASLDRAHDREIRSGQCGADVAAGSRAVSERHKHVYSVIGTLFPIGVTLALGFFAGMVMTKQSERTGNFGLATVIAAAMVRAAGDPADRPLRGAAGLGPDQAPSARAMPVCD
ncbi:MAG: response regulator [Pseudonocardiaceae bacterium]